MKTAITRQWIGIIGLPIVLIALNLEGCVVRQSEVRSPHETVKTAPVRVEPSGLTPTAPPAPSMIARPVAEGVRDGSTVRTATPPVPAELSPDIPAPNSQPTIPVSAAPYPIDLTASLRLADKENPTIAEARVAILDALAQQQAARAILLPSLNGGVSYHGHDGNLQRSSGRILRLSEQSLYLGGGARTLAAESVAIPAVNIFSPLTEAIFEPLAARQRVEGAKFEASATANTVLLEVANLFLELVGAEASLESQRSSAALAEQIVKVVADYAATGQGRKADANRAASDLRMLQGEILHEEEEVAVASARLSRRLNLDPAIRLTPLTGPLAPLEIIDATAPSETLIRTALERRPELVARTALISLAEFRHKEEKARPLLPTLWMGFSGGAMGGGSNLVPPTLAHFGGRTDFDVRAYWTLLNLGAGNASLANRRRAEIGQAVANRARMINLVRTEVISARAQALAQAEQVKTASIELASAEAGYREDYLRLREVVALPLEVLDSLKLLAQARLNLIRAITRANQAQFALFVALGSPPPLDPASPGLVASPPIATPLQSPILWPKDESIPRTATPGPPHLGK